MSDFAASAPSLARIEPSLMDFTVADTPDIPVLHRRSSISRTNDNSVCFRQVNFRQIDVFGMKLTVCFEAGDSAILVEYGAMNLDVFVRARIHAFQVNVQAKSVPGIGVLCPCIRSILVSPNS